MGKFYRLFSQQFLSVGVQYNSSTKQNWIKRWRVTATNPEYDQFKK